MEDVQGDTYTEEDILLNDGWEVRSEIGESDPETLELDQISEKGEEELEDCNASEELDHLLDESDPEMDIWEDREGEQSNVLECGHPLEFDDLAGLPPEPKLPYKPHEKNKTIMIQNLPVDTTKAQLSKFFKSKFGPVENVNLRTHDGYRIFSRLRVKNDPSIIAFVIFKKKVTCKKALKWKAKVWFRNQHIIINHPAHPKSKKLSLLVTNLSDETTEQDLLVAFRDCGKILSTEIQHRPNECFGYVTFDHHLSLAKASKMKYHLIRGREIFVEKCKEVVKMQRNGRKILRRIAKKKAKEEGPAVGDTDGYKMPFNADVPRIEVGDLTRSAAKRKRKELKGLNLDRVMSVNVDRQKVWKRQDMTWVNPNLRKHNN